MKKIMIIMLLALATLLVACDFQFTNIDYPETVAPNSEFIFQMTIEDVELPVSPDSNNGDFAIRVPAGWTYTDVTCTRGNGLDIEIYTDVSFNDVRANGDFLTHCGISESAEYELLLFSDQNPETGQSHDFSGEEIFCNITLVPDSDEGDFRIDTLLTVYDTDTVSCNNAITVGSLNADITINSISPANQIELKNGETQIYTADVTDEDGDATYSWKIDGVEVATTETFTAEHSNIEAGIHTLELNVSDVEFSDSITTTLEVRATGGSPSGSAPVVTGNVVEDNNDNDSPETVVEKANIFQQFWNWILSAFN